MKKLFLVHAGSVTPYTPDETPDEPTTGDPRLANLTGRDLLEAAIAIESATPSRLLPESTRKPLPGTAGLTGTELLTAALQAEMDAT
jgi:hypothetical protein